jgi:hypothetical protein
MHAWRCSRPSELTASGELVATEGLAVFPESKKFLLGSWIVDVQTPECAYAIADEFRQRPDREECRPICRLRCGE